MCQHTHALTATAIAPVRHMNEAENNANHPQATPMRRSGKGLSLQAKPMRRSGKGLSFLPVPASTMTLTLDSLTTLLHPLPPQPQPPPPMPVGRMGRGRFTSCLSSSSSSSAFLFFLVNFWADCAPRGSGWDNLGPKTRKNGRQAIEEEIREKRGDVRRGKGGQTKTTDQLQPRMTSHDLLLRFCPTSKTGSRRYCSASFAVLCYIRRRNGQGSALAA